MPVCELKWYWDHRTVKQLFLVYSASMVSWVLLKTSLFPTYLTDCTSVFPTYSTDCTSVFPTYPTDCTSVFPTYPTDCTSVFPTYPTDSTSVFPTYPTDSTSVFPTYPTVPTYPTDCTSVFPTYPTDCTSVFPTYPTDSTSVFPTYPTDCTSVFPTYPTDCTLSLTLDVYFDKTSSLVTSSPWTLFMFFKHVCKFLFSLKLWFCSAFSNFLILSCSVSISSGRIVSSAIVIFFLSLSIVSSFRLGYSQSHWLSFYPQPVMDTRLYPIVPSSRSDSRL